jgi:uncharacterized alkaline shock family protein YloU
MSNGKTIIYDDVFITLARIILESSDEVFYQEKKGNFPQFFGDKNAKTGISIRRKDTDEILDEHAFISYELKISVLYGVSIPETAQKIREKLSNEVKNLTGFEVDNVDITVERIIRMDKTDLQSDDAQPDNAQLGKGPDSSDTENLRDADTQNTDA